MAVVTGNAPAPAFQRGSVFKTAPTSLYSAHYHKLLSLIEFHEYLNAQMELKEDSRNYAGNDFQTSPVTTI